MDYFAQIKNESNTFLGNYFSYDGQERKRTEFHGVGLIIHSLHVLVLKKINFLNEVWSGNKHVLAHKKNHYPHDIGIHVAHVLKIFGGPARCTWHVREAKYSEKIGCFTVHGLVARMI